MQGQPRPDLESNYKVPPRKQKMLDNSNRIFKEPEFGFFEECLLCSSRCSLLFCPCQLCCQFETIQDYEKGVVLRLGRRMTEKPVSGGMHLLLPKCDIIMKVDMREMVLDIPKQSVVTRDGLTLTVDGVVYWRVEDAAKSLLSVVNIQQCIRTVCITKLRESLALLTYPQIQQDRKKLATQLKTTLDEAAFPWGGYVIRVELTDIRMPAAFAQALAAQEDARLIQRSVEVETRTQIEKLLRLEQNNAEIKKVQATAQAQASLVNANTKARSMAIAAEGEEKSAQASLDAANVLAQNPLAMQMRYLNTLTRIGQTPSNTVMVPMSADVMTQLGGGFLKDHKV